MKWCPVAHKSNHLAGPLPSGVTAYGIKGGSAQQPASLGEYMNEWIQGVRKFHEEKLKSHLPKAPTLVTEQMMLDEIYSMDSEMVELKKAFAQKDLVEIIDACADGIYILIGIAILHGVDLTPVFEDVQRSNMDKKEAAPGTFGRTAIDGGSMKPDNWVPPRIKQIIENQKNMAMAARTTAGSQTRRKKK